MKMLIYPHSRVIFAGSNKFLCQQQTSLGSFETLVCAFGICRLEQQVNGAGVAYVRQRPACGQANPSSYRPLLSEEYSVVFSA